MGGYVGVKAHKRGDAPRKRGIKGAELYVVVLVSQRNAQPTVVARLHVFEWGAYKGLIFGNFYFLVKIYGGGSALCSSGSIVYNCSAADCPALLAGMVAGCPKLFSRCWVGSNLNLKMSCGVFSVIGLSSLQPQKAIAVQKRQRRSIFCIN